MSFHSLCLNIPFSDIMWIMMTHNHNEIKVFQQKVFINFKLSFNLKVLASIYRKTAQFHNKHYWHSKLNADSRCKITRKSPAIWQTDHHPYAPWNSARSNNTLCPLLEEPDAVWKKGIPIVQRESLEAVCCKR